MEWMSLVARMPSPPEDSLIASNADGFLSWHIVHWHRIDGRAQGVDLAVQHSFPMASFGVDHVDLDAFRREEALLLGQEQRPIANPDHICNAQRLGVCRLAGARAHQQG